MRAREFTTEESEVKDIKKYILKNCQPYLNDIGGFKNLINERYAMYRGVNQKDNIKIVKPYKKRRPKDTAKKLHAAASQAMNELGIKARRDNSIFATGHDFEAMGYGEVYIVIPIGEYDFSWSSRTFDFSDQTNMEYFIRQRILSPANRDRTIKDLLNTRYETIHSLIDESEIKINYEKLKAFFEKHYKTTNIKRAIQSNNEIMLNGRLLLINRVFFLNHVRIR